LKEQQEEKATQKAKVKFYLAKAKQCLTEKDVIVAHSESWNSQASNFCVHDFQLYRFMML